MQLLCEMMAALAAGPAGLPSTGDQRARAVGWAWKAVELALARTSVRARLGDAAPALAKTIEAFWDSVPELAPTTSVDDALAELRTAVPAGACEAPIALPPSGESTDAVVVRMARELAAQGRSVLAGVLEAWGRARGLDDAWLVSCSRAALDQVLERPAASAIHAVMDAIAHDSAAIERLLTPPIAFENVQFTVYRPRTLAPGKWSTMLAFAHLGERGADDELDPVEEVARQARALLGADAAAYQDIVQDSRHAIPKAGEMTFVPDIPGVEVNPPRRTFRFEEAVHREKFRLRAGAALNGKVARGRLTVFLGSMIVAEVSLQLKVDAAAPARNSGDEAREPERAKSYRKVFASYSHRDLAIVGQFEEYAKSMGDHFMRDWVHLRTGEVWNARLMQMIEEADVFQLFWSWNSIGSEFVKQEWQHALSLGRQGFIRPTYWETPMPSLPGLPPEALSRLHFYRLGAAVEPAAAPHAAPPAAAAPAPAAPPPAAPAKAARAMPMGMPMPAPPPMGAGSASPPRPSAPPPGGAPRPPLDDMPLLSAAYAPREAAPPVFAGSPAPRRSMLPKLIGVVLLVAFVALLVLWLR